MLCLPALFSHNGQYKKLPKGFLSFYSIENILMTFAISHPGLPCVSGHQGISKFTPRKGSLAQNLFGRHQFKAAPVQAALVGDSTYLRQVGRSAITSYQLNRVIHCFIASSAAVQHQSMQRKVSFKFGHESLLGWILAAKFLDPISFRNECTKLIRNGYKVR